MGRAKEAMMDDEARGWAEPEGRVCADCVEDAYLKAIIRDHADEVECDYCGQITESNSAAPVAVLMEPIAYAVLHEFNDPTQAGVAYDGEWMAHLYDTRDVLLTIRLECDAQLFEDIADAFVYTDWARAPNGHWLAMHYRDELSSLWNNFVNIIKHEFRFFFQHPLATKPAEPWERDPKNILDTIGKLAKELELLSRIPAKVPLFRVRVRDGEADWPLDTDHMGAPPSDLARAGRMNPAGISYLYLAFEPETACAEVLNGPPCNLARANFETVRVLNILDLTELPEEPSIFDPAKENEREAILFLESFIHEMSQPVRKDGGEHIEYVPSQVVCEYFALAFVAQGEQHLDGIVYPSAVRPGGRNLVLFPTERGYQREFDQVKFISAEERSFDDWEDISRALKM